MGDFNQDVPPETDAPRLTKADAHALDALCDAGFDLDRVPRPVRDHAERVARVLGLLDEVMLDGQHARVGRVLDAIENEPAELSLHDAEALDAWVLAGLDAERVPASLRDRANAHESLAALVRDSSPRVSQFERASLVERTMAHVTSGEGILGPTDDVVMPRRNRLADMLSVAAILLLGVSVLWPAMTSVRDGARQATCAANMRGIAMGLGGYAGDNDDVMPMVTAGFSGNTWWNVGEGPRRSNSANLYTLARERYTTLAEMACPGNPNAITVPRSDAARDWGRLEEISYSYRVMAKPERELWGHPSSVVLVADRSPVVLRAVRGLVVFPLESSPNHRGQGQHGLTADGAATWLESPVLDSGDNIWLPKGIEMLLDMAARQHGIQPISGTEAPADREDSFVGP